jgi:hypothetical protein
VKTITALPIYMRQFLKTGKVKDTSEVIISAALI